MRGRPACRRIRSISKRLNERKGRKHTSSQRSARLGTTSHGLISSFPPSFPKASNKLSIPFVSTSSQSAGLVLHCFGPYAARCTTPVTGGITVVVVACPFCFGLPSFALLNAAAAGATSVVVVPALSRTRFINASSLTSPMTIRSLPDLRKFSTERSEAEKA